MKLSLLSEEKSEKFMTAFHSFKTYCLKSNKDTFKLEGFINFVNTNDFEVVGYTWHRDENQLESEFYGRIAVSFLTACECLANVNAKNFYIDENGINVKILEKIQPKTYRFL